MEKAQMELMSEILRLVCVLVLCVGPGVTSDVDLDQAGYLQSQVDRGVDTNDLFAQYKTIFGKSYEHGNEENKRRNIFKDNVHYIQQHNLKFAKGNKSYTLAVNEFADLSHAEFLATYTTNISPRRNLNRTERQKPHKTVLPATVDWRSQNCVTEVKKQGACGACWAFSATGSVEGQYSRKKGKLVSLSEQQLVDCDKFNFGCKNGFTELAYNYISATRGLETEQAYPYKAEKTECHFDQKKLVPFQLHGHVEISTGNEYDLQIAVASVGPVSASIDATHRSFQHAGKNGVYDEPACSQSKLSHGVLIVGYGKISKEFWLVKNSYGTSWGEAGYIRMSRNANNQCGIATLAMYPIL